MLNRTASLVLACAAFFFLLTGPLFPQSIWLDRSADRAIWLEVQKPHFSNDYLTGDSLFSPGLQTPLAQEDQTSFQTSPKSPGTALAWSLWGTLIPNAVGTTLLLASNEDWVEITGASLAEAGTVFGPSLGYFYAGLDKKGWSGNAIRGGLETARLIWLLSVAENGRVRSDDPAVTGGAIVAAVVIVHAIVDIAKVDGAVRKRNEKLPQTVWMVAPKYFAGYKTGGLELQVRF